MPISIEIDRVKGIITLRDGKRGCARIDTKDAGLVASLFEGIAGN